MGIDNCCRPPLNELKLPISPALPRLTYISPSLRIHAMHEANTALLDILVDNSVIIPSFQNRMERWAKRLFVGFEKDGLLAELQARTSRSCRFCCFLPHT